MLKRPNPRNPIPNMTNSEQPMVRKPMQDRDQQAAEKEHGQTEKRRDARSTEGRSRNDGAYAWHASLTTPKRRSFAGRQGLANCTAIDTVAANIKPQG